MTGSLRNKVLCPHHLSPRYLLEYMQHLIFTKSQPTYFLKGNENCRKTETSPETVVSKHMKKGLFPVSYPSKAGRKEMWSQGEKWRNNHCEHILAIPPGIFSTRSWYFVWGMQFYLFRIKGTNLYFNLQIFCFALTSK